MIINITNEEELDKKAVKRLNKVFKVAIKTLKQPTKLEINLSFVSEDDIKELNRENRNVDSVTDVLSFPYTNVAAGDIINIRDSAEFINLENKHISLGDVIICTKRASLQAVEYGHDVEAEIVRLLVHSILHLLGYDHIKDEDFANMHEKEMIICKKLGYNFED